MGEPATTAAPNDLKNPHEEDAVRENHDADLRPDDQPPTTIVDKDHSRYSTYTESDPEKGNVEKVDNGAPVQDQQTEPPDPKVVDWEGPDDPEKPTNWANGRKYAIIAIISSITFLTFVPPLGFSPALADTIQAPRLLHVRTWYPRAHGRIQLGQRRAGILCRLRLSLRICLWSHGHSPNVRRVWETAGLPCM